MNIKKGEWKNETKKGGVSEDSDNFFTVLCMFVLFFKNSESIITLLLSLHVLGYGSLFCCLSSSTAQSALISRALSPHHSSSCPPHRIPVRAGPTVRSLLVRASTSKAAIKEISVATRPVREERTVSCRTRLSVWLTVVLLLRSVFPSCCKTVAHRLYNSTNISFGI